MSEPNPDLDDIYSAPEAELSGARSLFVDSAISPRSWQVLASTRPWVWITGAALCLIGVLLTTSMVILWLAVREMGIVSVRGTLLVAILLVLLASWVFIHLGIRLFRFALAITRALESRDEFTLSKALDRHRLFWIMFGIPAILFSVIFVMSKAFL